MGGRAERKRGSKKQKKTFVMIYCFARAQPKTDEKAEKKILPKKKAAPVFISLENIRKEERAAFLSKYLHTVKFN